MQRTIFATTILATVLAAQLGCSGADPTAPNATEPLSVTIQLRTPAPGAAVPAVYAFSAAGDLVVRVTRPALCGTVVSAAVRRGPQRIDIVSHVSPNPLADCSVDVSGDVVDYVGTVSSLTPGPYLVRVFEGLGDETPRFIGSAKVDVTAVVCLGCLTQ